MNFLHPALFAAGAAAVAVPIIIHLLYRRRFKVVHWAAMEFLLESLRRNRRRLHMEQWLLLAARCLAVLLAAAVVGRLSLYQASGAAAEKDRGRPTVRVFVLDDSPSMGQKLAGGALLDKATAELAGRLGQLGSADKVMILRTSHPSRAEAVFDLGRPNDLDTLTHYLQSLKPSDLSGDLAAALRTANEVLAAETVAKRVYVLSDFRAVNYASPEEVAKAAADLKAQGAQLTLLHFALPPAGNVTVHDLRLLENMAVAGAELRVQAQVRNDGPTRAENLPVSFELELADGARVSLGNRIVAALDAGAETTVQMEFTAPAAGAAAVRAAIEGDALPADDAAVLALDVRPARRVLLVDGHGDAARPVEGACFYLARALDPYDDGRYGTRAEIISAGQFAQANLDNYDAIVSADVPQLPEPAAAGLERYVRAGGGVCWFWGPQCQVDFYRQLAQRGLYPMNPQAVAGNAAAKDRYVRLAAGSIADEPMLRSFQGSRGGFTQLLRFYAWVEGEPLAAAPERSAPAARVLARFDSPQGGPGGPAIVAGRLGAGQVVAVATTANQDWTDWPKDFTFVSFANDLIDAIGHPRAALTDLTGQAIVFPVGSGASRARLQTPAFPAQDIITLEGRAEGGQGVFRFERPEQAGLYHLQIESAGAPQSVLLARNIDPAEGRLAVMNRTGLRAALQADFDYLQPLEAAPDAASAGSTSKEYWRWLLAALAAMLAIEGTLAYRAGHFDTPNVRGKA